MKIKITQRWKCEANRENQPETEEMNRYQRVVWRQLNKINRN